MGTAWTKKFIGGKMKILILAGGGGTRLFPLSRTCYPKQFLSIAGKESLLSEIQIAARNSYESVFLF